MMQLQEKELQHITQVRSASGNHVYIFPRP